jgi:hypothetical protein
MKILVTGSAGHLGEALMRTLPALGHDAGPLSFRMMGEFVMDRRSVGGHCGGGHCAAEWDFASLRRDIIK